MSEKTNQDLSSAVVNQAKELGIDTPALELTRSDGYDTPEGDGNEQMGNITPGSDDDSKEDLTPSASDETSAQSAEEDEDLETKPRYTKEQIRDMAVERQQRRQGRYAQLESKMETFESKLDKLVDALSKGNLTATQSESKVEQWAKKNKFDPNQAKELADAILGDRVEPKQQEEEQLETLSTNSLAVDDPELEKQYFEAEWEESLEDIETIYPNASNSQMIAAKKLLDEISHSSPKLVQYELVDIMNSPRFKSQFDDILNTPKKRGFEEGRNRESRTREVNFDSQVTGTKQALEMEQKLFELAQQSGKTPIISPTGDVL